MTIKLRSEVRPRLLTASLGAIIDGIDLRVVDDDQFEALHRSVLRHRVVFLRHQNFDRYELATLAGSFGTVTPSPLHQLLGSARTVTTIEDRADCCGPPPSAAKVYRSQVEQTPAQPRMGEPNRMRLL